MLPAVPVQQLWQIQPGLAPAVSFFPEVPATVGKRHCSVFLVPRERHLSCLNLVLGKSKNKILKHNISEDSRAAQIYIRIDFSPLETCVLNIGENNF